MRHGDAVGGFTGQGELERVVDRAEVNDCLEDIVVEAKKVEVCGESSGLGGGWRASIVDAGYWGRGAGKGVD